MAGGSETTLNLKVPEQDREVKRPRSPGLRVRSFGMTHPGKVRKNNEDQFLIAQLAKAMQIEQSSLAQSPVRYGEEMGHLFLVADGMGGQAAGEQASALAVDAVERCVLNTFKWFFQLKGGEESEVLAEFQTALHDADASLFAASARHPELAGMGTTLTLAYSLDTRLFVAHVGDSRCYLCRDQSLYRLTHDHTMAQELVRAGRLNDAEAARNPYRHVVTNVIGGHAPGLDVEVHRVGLEAGDRILLCSDGLTEMVNETEIARILHGHGEPQEATEQLLRAALDQGGRDNVTVIVVNYDGEDATAG